MGKGGVPIYRCVELFHEVRRASVQLAEFADRYPTLYSELERRRAIENLNRKSIRVRFFGKSLYSDERYRPKAKRVKLRDAIGC
jgi:D-alanyl-D-alanine dipeptidase